MMNSMSFYRGTRKTPQGRHCRREPIPWGDGTLSKSEWRQDESPGELITRRIEYCLAARGID